MNKLLLISMLLLILFESCKSKVGKPGLLITNRSVDLNKIQFDSTYDLFYTIINNGQADLIIDTVTTSCGCTIPSIPTKKVPPFDSVILSTRFKPVDTGYFDKRIIIKSNIDSIFTILSFKGRAVK